MNCASCEERLSDYLENALAVSEHAAVQTHLQGCASCSELLDGVRLVIQWGKDFQVQPPPAWLPARIVANTPQVVRVTWADWSKNAWRNLLEPRFAMALLTATLVLGWMGSLAGITASDVAMIRRPSEIYYRIDGWANRVYGDAVRGYYGSSIVNAIHCQIHTQIEQFRENS
jgi:predicted anti-sigma-YlaC factor YlaD